jgi:hypothetical protein
VIVITGDIHWGRLVSWSPRAGNGRGLVEFVSSPIARVGLRSTLGTSLKVGRASNPENKPDDGDWAVLHPVLGGCARAKHFATGENNVGVIELNRGPDGSVVAQFELWSLDTRQLARNRWPTTGPDRCTAVLPL